MQYRGFAGDERRDAKSEVVSVCPLRVAPTVTSTQQGKRRNPLAGNLEHAGLKQRAAMALLLTADLSTMQNGRMTKRPQSLGEEIANSVSHGSALLAAVGTACHFVAVQSYAA